MFATRTATLVGMLSAAFALSSTAALADAAQDTDLTVMAESATAENTPRTKIRQLESRADGNHALKVANPGTAFANQGCTVSDRAVLTPDAAIGDRLMLPVALEAITAQLCVQLRVDGCVPFNEVNPENTAPLVTKVQLLVGGGGAC